MCIKTHQYIKTYEILEASLFSFYRDLFSLPSIKENVNYEKLILTLDVSRPSQLSYKRQTNTKVNWKEIAFIVAHKNLWTKNCLPAKELLAYHEHFCLFLSIFVFCLFESINKKNVNKKKWVYRSRPQEIWMPRLLIFLCMYVQNSIFIF